MALNFYEQLPKELQCFDGLPAVVVGYGLKNLESGNYRLGLVRTEATQVRPAKILAERIARFNDEDVSLETGLPSKLTGGDRTLYTASQKAPSLDNLGLSGLCLGRYLDLDSSDEDLAGSLDAGRVVLVRNEVAGADFMAKYAAEITAEVARQQSELLQRGEQALKLLRGD